MNLKDAKRHQYHMKKVSDAILKFGYHGAEKILVKAFFALGFGYWAWGKSTGQKKIGNFPEELKNEKKWMSELTFDEANLLREYFFAARSLAYRYLRSKTAKKIEKVKA